MLMSSLLISKHSRLNLILAFLGGTPVVDESRINLLHDRAIRSEVCQCRTAVLVLRPGERAPVWKLCRRGLRGICGEGKPEI